MIEYRKINLEEQGWDYSTGRSVMVMNTNERIIILDKGIEKWRNWANGVTANTTKINDGDKVYFLEDVVFPRRKFAKKFTKNKLVTSVEKADVIVVDSNRLVTKLGWYSHHYDRDFYSLNDGRYSGDHACKLRDGKDDFKGQVYHSEKILKECIEMMTNAKKIIDIKNVNLPSEEVLDEESFERIDKMLSSSDPQIVNMGMNVLTAFDMERDKFRMSILLKLNWMNWMNKKDKPNVEVRGYLNKMKKEFPEIEQQHGDSINRYWLNLILEHPEDLVVFKKFNLFIRKYIQTDKEVKLVYVDTDKQEGDLLQESSTVHSNEQGS